jgi:hypothetical protein
MKEMSKWRVTFWRGKVPRDIKEVRASDKKRALMGAQDFGDGLTIGAGCDRITITRLRKQKRNKKAAT